MRKTEFERAENAEKESIKGAQRQIPIDKKWKEMTKDLGLEEVDGIFRCTGRMKNSELELHSKKPNSVA